MAGQGGCISRVGSRRHQQRRSARDPHSRPTVVIVVPLRSCAASYYRAMATECVAGATPDKGSPPHAAHRWV